MSALFLLFRSWASICCNPPLIWNRHTYRETLYHWPLPNSSSRVFYRDRVGMTLGSRKVYPPIWPDFIRKNSSETMNTGTGFIRSLHLPTSISYTFLNHHSLCVVSGRCYRLWRRGGRNHFRCQQASRKCRTYFGRWPATHPHSGYFPFLGAVGPYGHSTSCWSHAQESTSCHPNAWTAYRPTTFDTGPTTVSIFMKPIVKRKKNWW